MEERAERAIKFAEMHKTARLSMNKSQEYMALSLGVTKKTVSNWEKGLSSPTYFQSLEWFRCLNINPFPYYLKFTFPEPKSYTKKIDVDSVLNKLIDVLPDYSKMALIYLLTGEHGSSPNAIIQLLLAYLHCPIKTRLTQATLIAHNFEIEKELGCIICKDDIMPDMEILNAAISKAWDSVLKHEYGYSNVEKDTP